MTAVLPAPERRPDVEVEAALPSPLTAPPPGPAGSGNTSSFALPMLPTNRGSMYGPVR